MMTNEDTEKVRSRSRRLYQVMGWAMTRWADVEQWHYLAFFKMLSGPPESVCSILYYSSPTFESKRVLVDRVATEVLPTEHRKAWTELNKRMESGGAKRGRIAHYHLGFSFKESEGKLPDIDDAVLRPSEHNYLKRPQWREATTVSVEDVIAYGTEFGKIADDLRLFVAKIPFSEPLKREDFLSILSPYPETPALRSLRFLSSTTAIPTSEK